ncbi:Fic family protein [Frondihabitans australicus]|uniref:Fic family protein n=1 Tax=Frondihabitans australicus TaxID=386892 RepID=A0A495IKY1_9MICO|nr:Fic family protein [Frondihabitans australicus]RKR75785.1 Fic family protein [Frondihabitans australicus]
MSWNPGVPFNDLPDLPPRFDVETRDVLKATIEARAALAALDRAAAGMPNPTVLINAIPLLEAQASSEIENIVTTTDELFRFAADEARASDPATREALRYRTALRDGFVTVAERPLTASTAVRVCSTIKSRDMHVRKNPGTFIGNPTTQEAVYTPPAGEALLLEKLANWESFIHSDDDLDPLVRMAIAHYQFEAIHPFDDGNGRTGRILNILMLVEAGLLAQPILYLSRYIIRHKATYYALLGRVTSGGAWIEWVLFMLEATRQTAISTLRKIDSIRDLQVELHETIRATIRGGVNADLLALLFEQPYCRIGTVVERCGVSRPTATGWLNALVEAGVLTDVRRGRDRLFVNGRFLELLVRDEPDASTGARV